MIRFIFPLAFLLCSVLPSAVQAQNELTEKGGFSTSLNEEHVFIFVLNDRPADLPELRTGITKYLWKNHPNDKLKITQIEVDGDLAGVPLILISGFASKTAALDFYNALKKNRPDFLQMGMTKDFFPLSKTNYNKVLLAKSLNGYKPFFEQNYLN